MKRNFGRAGLVLIAFLLLDSCDSDVKQLPVETLSIDGNCDVTGVGCTARSGSMQWAVHLERPAVALKPFPVTLTVIGAGERLGTVRVRFDMAEMSMGLNEYQMVQTGDNAWKAEVTLPICTSGRSDWRVRFSAESEHRRWTMVVPFRLEPPGDG